MSGTKIKICGISRPADAEYINEAMPDYAGFVFVPESRRYVTPERAAGLRAAIDPRVVTVGVFRDAGIPFIAGLVSDGTIGAVQLHGAEDDAYIMKLKEALAAVHSADVPIIKAIRVEGAGSFACDSSADFLLFDNGSGGTGERFDIGLLDAARVQAAGVDPRLAAERSDVSSQARGNDSDRCGSDNIECAEQAFFLAGGIDIANVGEALARGPYGIDVSSGAETDGVKDRAKILALVRTVRDAKEVVITSEAKQST
jgi:phosphoribosylanthranilate isomerase